jgi:hypothetical protein
LTLAFTGFKNHTERECTHLINGCFFVALALGIAAGVCGRAHGIAGTDRIAEPGKPYSEQLARNLEWPKGALELVNDPARTFGWHHWFSELPNDVMRFEYRIKDTAELNRLIEKLAAIDVSELIVFAIDRRSTRIRAAAGWLGSGGGQWYNIA